MFKEFKEFSMNGNVIDLPFDIFIGGAFGKIVTAILIEIPTPSIVS